MNEWFKRSVSGMTLLVIVMDIVAVAFFVDTWGEGAYRVQHVLAAALMVLMNSCLVVAKRVR